MTALLPTLSQVGKERIEFALTLARGTALWEGPGSHRAMHHLPTNMQVPRDRPLAQPLTMQCDDLLITNQAIGATNLPMLLGNGQQAHACCWSLVLRCYFSRHACNFKGAR